MRKIFLLFFVGLSSLLFAQDGDGAQEFRSILFSNLHVFPSDSAYKIVYTFKLPYNRIVFEKKGDKYTGEFNISIEVFDSSNNFVVRTHNSKKIETDSFEQTDSDVLYSEGLCEFELGKGEFKVLPVLTDIKSGREIKLKPHNLNTSKYFESRILDPLIINGDSVQCGDKSLFALANFDGNIPFSEEESSMLIPVTDEAVNSIQVSIVSNKDTIFNKTLSESLLLDFTLAECSNRIVLKSLGTGKQNRYFALRNFSNDLNPGNVIITISEIGNLNSKKELQKAVVWYNKPLSLNNSEFAVRALKHIDGDSVVSRLLKEDSDNYQQALLDYWKKYDPTPGTSFNQLMNEYYQRIDFALMNFRPIDGKSGADTDRGKILIQFGKPQKVERTSNEYGKVVETWVYEKPQRKFIFVDQKGTGNFSLTKG